MQKNLLFILLSLICYLAKATTIYDTISTNTDTTIVVEEIEKTDSSETITEEVVTEKASAKTIRIYDTAYSYFIYPKIDTSKLVFSFSIATKKLQADNDFWYLQEAHRFNSNTAIVFLVTDSATIDDVVLNNNSYIAQKSAIDVHQLKKFNTESSSKTKYPKWLGKLLWLLLIITLLGAIVYFLHASGLLKYKNKNTQEYNSKTNEESTDIFSLNYYKLFEEALANKNYTQYIRLQYLQTIALMANKKIITYQPDFTANNYLQQLASTKYYKGFALVNLHYQYVWFGKFEVTETIFNTISNNTSAFQQTLQ